MQRKRLTPLGLKVRCGPASGLALRGVGDGAVVGPEKMQEVHPLPSRIDHAERGGAPVGLGKCMSLNWGQD